MRKYHDNTVTSKGHIFRRKSNANVDFTLTLLLLVLVTLT